VVGGYSSVSMAATEKWNGTAWATTTAMTQAKHYFAGSGTVQKALSFGGTTGVPSLSTTEN